MANALGVRLLEELTCEGRWRTGRQPEVAHVVLTQYRWWVRLWGDSDGNVKVQTDNYLRALDIPFIDKIGVGSLTRVGVPGRWHSQTVKRLVERLAQ
jgi:hypothetical protein